MQLSWANKGPILGQCLNPMSVNLYRKVTIGPTLASDIKTRMEHTWASNGPILDARRIFTDCLINVLAKNHNQIIMLLFKMAEL